MARGIDLKTPRTLNLVEEMDGFSCVVIRQEGSRVLNRQIVMFHMAMMAAFITILGAPFAWAAALFNILRSPKVASWRLECTQHAVQITELYTRFEPGTEQATSDDRVCGPLLFGRGEPAPPVDIPFSELAEVGWEGHRLWFVMNDGKRREYAMNLLEAEGVAEVGRAVEGMFERFGGGVVMSAEEAERERRKLDVLVTGV